MPTPFAIAVRSGHDLFDLAQDLIQDPKMHLDCLLGEKIFYFLIGGLSGKAADEFGRVEKKNNTDALAYLGLTGFRGVPESVESGSPIDLDSTVFLVKINRRWWEALGLDVKNGEKLRRQRLHGLLCSIVPSESGGQVVKPDIKIFTEQITAFGHDLEGLQEIDRLLKRYDSGGQEQLPLGEDSDLRGEGEENASGASPFSTPDYLPSEQLVCQRFPPSAQTFLPWLAAGRFS